MRSGQIRVAGQSASVIVLALPSGLAYGEAVGARWDTGVSAARPCRGDPPMLACLIIVSRDQPELLHALLALYGNEEGVEIRLDRRNGQAWTGLGDRPDRRSPPSPDTNLEDHGFIVIPRR